MACAGRDLPRRRARASVKQARQVRGHLVEGARELGQLSRAALGRARLEVAAGERRGRIAEAVESTPTPIGRATRSAEITAAEAEAAVTARIFTSSPMWNMTQPDRRTAASGRTTARNASPAS